MFCDQKGNPLLELPSSTDDKNLNLRIKRSLLKAGLRAAAPDVTINYGMECAGYRNTDGGVDVQFRNGQTVHADYGVVARGRKAVLESRSAARQFHMQSRFQRMNRNVGFRMANIFIKMFSKRSHPVTAQGTAR